MIVDEALGKIYETYYMQVYSFVMTLAGNKDTAQEITQETFFKVMTSKHSFRGESDQLSWLCAIAKNLFTDELRRKARNGGELPEDRPDESKSIEERLADKDMSFQIHLALHDLGEPYKEVFELRVFGELSFKQIGQIFKKTESWARVTYHRARLKLKERLDNNEV
ncbi:MAG: sigma-70 family RNA polymerase sigma factor [Ruminococcus sp.]|nr:sigma-70 family RNA polymerase sigma factor [Ruminococcus sp.]